MSELSKEEIISWFEKRFNLYGIKEIEALRASLAKPDKKLRELIEEAWWKVDAHNEAARKMMPTPKEHKNLLGNKEKYLLSLLALLPDVRREELSDEKLRGEIASYFAESHGYVFPSGIEEDDTTFRWWADRVQALLPGGRREEQERINTIAFQMVTEIEADDKAPGDFFKIMRRLATKLKEALKVE